MTRPNTPGYIPGGPAIQVAWDPDDHVFKVVPGGAGLLSAESAQNAVDAIAAATTIADLREAVLAYVEATSGLTPAEET
jgi:hypothetical protein